MSHTCPLRTSQVASVTLESNQDESAIDYGDAACMGVLKVERCVTAIDEVDGSSSRAGKADVLLYDLLIFFFFSSRRRHTRFDCDWSSDVCSSDLKSEYSHISFSCRWLHHYQVFSSPSTLNICTSTIHKYKITRVF